MRQADWKQYFQWRAWREVGAMIVAFAAASGSAPAIAKSIDCPTLLAPGHDATEDIEIDARKLVGLREFVLRPSPLAQQAFSISPDGRHVAFLLRQADPEENAYCTGLVIMDVADPSSARIVDATKEFVEALPIRHGPWQEFEPQRLPSPLWSQDGEWVAYLRRDDGITNIWIAPGSTGPARQLTNATVSIENFAWVGDGSRSLVVASRPEMTDALRDLDTEARFGWRFDRRFEPIRGLRPFVNWGLPIAHEVIDIATGVHSPASSNEIETLARRSEGPGTLSAPWRAISGTGKIAEIFHPNPEQPWLPTRLRLSTAQDQWECEFEACTDLEGIWWSAQNEQLFLLRREGHGRGNLSIFALTDKATAPRHLYTTTDELTGCQLQHETFFCIRAGSTSPPKLVSLDPSSGGQTLVFDPNPETTFWRFGDVARLEWTTAAGLPVFGDLVLPPSYARGDRVPLIIVGYRSRGFLKGGTGDEYPIHALAARGYAVLSYDMNSWYGVRYNPKDIPELVRASRRDWGELRDQQTMLEIGVSLVEDTIGAEIEEIGLTGFSAGATLGMWAIRHSKRFSAAAFSHCCDTASTFAILGFNFYDRWRSFGRPRLTDGPTATSQEIFPHLGDNRVDIPVLLQMSDAETLIALEAFMGLHYELEKPIDLYVFRNERHVKSQPAHRLAIYERSMDWFDFWLKGIEHPSPQRAEEYQQWRLWREGLP